MHTRKALTLVATAVVGLLLPAAALALKLRIRAAAHAHAAAGGATPSRSTRGVSEIGALYAASGATRHTCTAGVVDSPRGNTLITAAHCVSGSGAGRVFVPDEHGGRAPYGRWAVATVHVAPGWCTRRDPHEDVAFLTVAPRRIGGTLTEIQQVTGGYRLGSTARAHERVTVTGYPAGTDNDPITCRAEVYMTGVYPSFRCRGYLAGTSGAPWLRVTSHGTRIVGVIGGLNQGGCDPDTSYSTLLDGTARAAYRLAASGTTPDVAPAPGGDGCG